MAYAKDDKKTKVIPTRLSVCPPGLLQSKEMPTKASAMENIVTGDTFSLNTTAIIIATSTG